MNRPTIVFVWRATLRRGLVFRSDATERVPPAKI
jgi:hypothetical protein